MRRHHLLLALLRRATSAVSHVAGPLHPFLPRNGAAAPLSLRLFSSPARSAAGAAKSLIEDEAELSDWISDLKTDNFHLDLSSGDEADAASSRRPAVAASRGGRGGRDSRESFSKSRFGGGDRRGFERRGRAMSSDLDDDDDEGGSGFGSGRGRHGGGGRSSEFSHRGGRGNGFDDDAGFRSSRGQRGCGGRAMVARGGRFSDLDEGTGFGSSGGRRGRGGRMSGLSQRRGRGSDLDDDEDDDVVGFGSQRGRRGRGGRMSGFSQRRGRGSDLDDGEDDDDDAVGFGSQRGRRGRGGRMSGFSQRRGRGSDLDDDAIGFGDSSRRQVRGRRGGKMEGLSSRRGGRSSDVEFGHRKARGETKFDFGVSEDDDEAGEFDEDDEPSGFEDDLSGDEVGEDVGKIQGNKPTSFHSTEGESATQERVGTSGGGAGDSYLSLKR
jgi:hypothetical protein